MKKIIGKITAFAMLLSLCVSLLCSCNEAKNEYVRHIFAFDTYITVKIYETDGKNTDSFICDSIANLVNDLDKKLSFTNSDSEIFKLNSLAATEPVKVDAQIYWLIKASVDLCTLTDGAFDITLGMISSFWGFYDDKPSKPDFEKIEMLAGEKNYKNIIFDDEELSIKFKNEHFALDLGAIGKGYALDLMNELLTKMGVTSAVIDFGGAIMTIGDNNEDGWDIGVSDGADGTVGSLLLPAAYVATSNAQNRFVEYDGKKYHHILDGNTGYPSDSDIISCSVVSDNGIISDAMSTACFVMGKDKLLKFYEKYPICEFVLITKDNNVTVTDGLKNSFTENSGDNE